MRRLSRLQRLAASADTNRRSLRLAMLGSEVLEVIPILEAAYEFHQHPCTEASRRLSETISNFEGHTI